jgi:hypothetical protein
LFQTRVVIDFERSGISTRWKREPEPGSLVLAEAVNQGEDNWPSYQSRELRNKIRLYELHK